jgi:hypothetical protein
LFRWNLLNAPVTLPSHRKRLNPGELDLGLRFDNPLSPAVELFHTLTAGTLRALPGRLLASAGPVGLDHAATARHERLRAT